MENRVENIEENKKLVEEYPFLLPRNVWTNEPIDDYDYSWVLFKDEVPQGWWDRLGIPICKDLKDVLIRNNALDRFRFAQIKEKYGSIRLYDFGAPWEWLTHVFAWEYISKHTCIKCGKFPVRMRDDGWICPWCDDCFEENLKHRWADRYDDTMLEDYTDYEEDRLLEYLDITNYNENGKRITYVDLKPYYDAIGYDYSNDNLITIEELEEMNRETD